MKLWIKGIAIASLAASLFACGFHLRSASEVPSELHYINLQTPANQIGFSSTLLDLFDAMEIKVATKPGLAPFKLVISDLKFSHDLPAITSVSTPTVYTYTYSFNFAVLSRLGSTVVPQQSVSVNQQITASPDQMITTNSASTRIRGQLKTQAIEMLFNRLSSYNVKQALAKCEMNPEHCGLTK